MVMANWVAKKFDPNDLKDEELVVPAAREADDQAANEGQSAVAGVAKKVQMESAVADVAKRELTVSVEANVATRKMAVSVERNLPELAT